MASEICKTCLIWDSEQLVHLKITYYFFIIITLLPRRAWRSYKLCSFFLGFFFMSETRLLLMGDTTWLAATRTHRQKFNLSSCSSRMSQQNTHFNLYTEISKRQRCFRCKNPHPNVLNCQILTDFTAKYFRFLSNTPQRLNSFFGRLSQQNTHFIKHVYWNIWTATRFYV